MSEEMTRLKYFLDKVVPIIGEQPAKSIYQDVEIATLQELLVEKGIFTKEELLKREENLLEKAEEHITQGKTKDF